MCGWWIGRYLLRQILLHNWSGSPFLCTSSFRDTGSIIQPRFSRDKVSRCSKQKHLDKIHLCVDVYLFYCFIFSSLHGADIILPWKLHDPRQNANFQTFPNICTRRALLFEWRSEHVHIERYSVYSLVSTEVLTRPSSPSRPVHTETISISQGIFQSNWQHIAHTL